MSHDIDDKTAMRRLGYTVLFMIGVALSIPAFISILL